MLTPTHQCKVLGTNEPLRFLFFFTIFLDNVFIKRPCLYVSFLSDVDSLLAVKNRILSKVSCYIIKAKAATHFHLHGSG